MFRFESYVAPILLSYIDKYVRDFKPVDAQVSLWGGGVALHNLVLKTEVLQKELSLPFSLISGRIHELFIQVPWTKIMSEPIVVTIDTIECVLGVNPTSTNEEAPSEKTSVKAQVVEAPPGYMQALVRRIVSNISLKIHHLIVKYVQDDIVLSLNVKHLSLNSAGSSWEPAFADIDQAVPVLRKIVHLDDLTLCLDRADADGKIRFYHEPILYRCQLDLRICIRLVSANIRRASSFAVEVHSTKLAWGVTNEQLMLLMRMCRELGTHKQNTAATKLSAPVNQQPQPSVSGELTHQDSWSQWAWSWLPSWESDSSSPVPDGCPGEPGPLPVFISVKIDAISFMFKIMETEGSNRKRARNILDFYCCHAIMKISIAAPTAVKFQLGIRTLSLMSTGKCVCYHLDRATLNDEPTVYLEALKPSEAEWNWPADNFFEEIVDPTMLEEERTRLNHITEELKSAKNLSSAAPPEEISLQNLSFNDCFWEKLEPQIYVDFVHERCPPVENVNPYENPPKDFQYSDWIEDCSTRITVMPISFRPCSGLIHRLKALFESFNELPPIPVTELPRQVLTVEENEALSENLPQRRTIIDIKDLRITFIPWDHVPVEKPCPLLLYLDVNIPRLSIVLTGPLYPHRVCVAASQLPQESGPLWQAARSHVTGIARELTVAIRSPNNESKTCARVDLKFVTHLLLNKSYFQKDDKETVDFHYTIKIREINICGSASRLHSALQVILTIIQEEQSSLLYESNIVRDAFNRDDAVALDCSLEDISLRGYVTNNTYTNIFSLFSAKCTVLQAPEGAPLKQAWLFSAPDADCATPFLRIAAQWCKERTPKSVEYIGVWTEPVAVCFDALFAAWLDYKPSLRVTPETQPATSSSSSKPTSSIGSKRRFTPPSSSGRGASKTGSVAELIHTKVKSGESSSGKSEIHTSKAKKQKKSPFLSDEQLVVMHQRLRRALVLFDLGIVQLYLPPVPTTAVNTNTVQNAMEMHAENISNVSVISLGRVSLHSSSNSRLQWQDVRNDGPTALEEVPKEKIDSFPFKMTLADVSWHLMEPNTSADGGEKTVSTLRSNLKSSPVTIKTILDPVTTTMTLSVVQKCAQSKSQTRKSTSMDHIPKRKYDEVKDEKLKYYSTGLNFRPTTFKEFLRGPKSRKETSSTENEGGFPSKSGLRGLISGTKAATSPVVSLGVHLHVDTPPILVRLDGTHVPVMAKSIHCINHIVNMMKDTVQIPRHHSYMNLINNKSSKSDAVHDTNSESGDLDHSDIGLVAIFERQAEPSLKVYFWFQWVLSRVTCVVTIDSLKIGFNIDDIIGTVDLQQYYNQFKLKVAAVSVKHQQRTGVDEWNQGVFGGRILEVREPPFLIEDNNFLTVTVTQAWISNLPDNWKGSLHPKLLQYKKDSDEMWEIYATLAPLEVVLRPSIIRNLSSVLKQILNQKTCPMKADHVELGTNEFDSPFCYVTAGGVRIILIDDDLEDDSTTNVATDDTFIFRVETINLIPHPANPIIRRPVSSAQEAVWSGCGTVPDGIQFEIQIKSVDMRSAKFEQLVHFETADTAMLRDGTSSENPALKWTQPTAFPTITSMLHCVDLCFVLAPPFFKGHCLTYGPAFEFNLVSDCHIEMTIDQLSLAKVLSNKIMKALEDANSDHTSMADKTHWNLCPFSHVLMKTFESSDAPLYSDETLDEDIISPGLAPSTPENITNSENTEYVVQDDIEVKRRKDSDQESRPYFGSFTEIQKSAIADSGVETYLSRSTLKSTKTQELKKSVSVAFFESSSDPMDYLEIFVTTGTIEVSFYKVGGTEDVDETTKPNNVSASDAATSRSGNNAGTETAKSISEVNRETPEGIQKDMPFSQKTVSKRITPLLNIMLRQPNLYYWRRKQQKTLQGSLHDACIRMGCDAIDDVDDVNWNCTVFSTAQGPLDPSTDIPPSLITIAISDPGAALSSSKGSVKIDVERPVLLEVDCNRLKRLQAFQKLIKCTLGAENNNDVDYTVEKISPLLKIRKNMVTHLIESVIVNITQISLSGPEGAVSFDTLNFQITAPLRLEKLIARGLITAFTVVTGSPNDCRHLLLQPCTFGMDLVAKWKAWKKMSEGHSSTDLLYHVCVDVDTITIDVRPTDLLIVQTLKRGIEEVLDTKVDKQPQATSEENRASTILDFTMEDVFSHFYQDDLRSGAFKVINGAKMPQVYQITIHEDCVSWKYPQPRAIARLLTLPILYEDDAVDCVLEVYLPLLRTWEQHTYFEISTSEPKEFQIFTTTPFATIFAKTWRFRICTEKDKKPRKSYEFDFNKFIPKTEPCITETNEFFVHGCGKNMAQDLISAVKVDSYFAVQGLSTAKMSIRCVSADIYVHNDLPRIDRQSTSLEGYYVSKPLMRAHRVMRLSFCESIVHSRINSHVLVNTTISSEIFDCAKGTMEPFISKFHVQGTVAMRSNTLGPRSRMRTSVIRVALNIPRIRTIESFVIDWKAAYKQHIMEIEDSDDKSNVPTVFDKSKVISEIEKKLEGRVCLWINNNCVYPMRVGQEGTDEVIPLGPDSRLAYRWLNPTAPKKLHFALIGPVTDWSWSASVPFVVGKYRVRLEEESTTSSKRGSVNGPFMHISVTEEGARMHMTLFGRLALANLLRIPLQYKIRLRYPNSGSQWRTIISGELAAESFGSTVLCNTDAEMLLKIKLLSSSDTGWSGDIPIKECPKENMPWLVKVPSEGEVPYLSVWCRVVRGRSDARLLATIWPLYILRSYLPLNTDVLITSEASGSSTTTDSPVPPILQSAKGRGHVTHIYAPGTTSVRHSLTFQYTEVDYAVTREAVPLHYGVTDTSVFTKHSPPQFVNDVIADINAWIKTSERDACPDWPFSLVTKHCKQQIEPTILQPRSDVTVRYAAVRAGGGCSLEMRLCPLALLVNAAPVALTLRAHDAAPLCKLEPYMCLSPPHAALQKPFFISIEQGRDTFVSRQLSVWDGEPGAYGQVPAGCIAIDKPTSFAIQCNHKIALLTMYYEIKAEINVLGVSSTYVIINRLNTDLLVLGVAVPSDMSTNVTIRHQEYTTVPPVTDENDVVGSPLCHLLIHGRLRGSEPVHYRSYLCLNLAVEARPISVAAPVRLGRPPVRRSLALRNKEGRSIPVVLTQVHNEGRWIITVAPDPCPQFVLHNKTQLSIRVAQPAKGSNNSQRTETAVECEGLQWWCLIEPKDLIHYSTPAHCWRYPPCQSCPEPEVPFLCLAHVTDVSAEPVFSAGVAAADGEQLIQLRSGATIKMHVRTRPHSTFVTFRDVNQFDLSASDIRKRLTMHDVSEVSIDSWMNRGLMHNDNLTRTDGADKLFHSAVEHSDSDDRDGAKENKAGQDFDPDTSTTNAESAVEPAIASSSRAIQSSLISHYTSNILPDCKEQLRRKHVSDTQSFEPKQLTVCPKSYIRRARDSKSYSKVSLAVAEMKGSKAGKMECYDTDSMSVRTVDLDMHVLQYSMDEDMVSRVLPTHAEEFKRLSFSIPQAANYGSVDTQNLLRELSLHEWRDSKFPLSHLERSRCVISGIVIELASAGDTKPLLALHIDRLALLHASDDANSRATVTIADIQVDNLLYNSGQYDFAVIATTRNEPLEEDPWPPMWNMFAETDSFSTRQDSARLIVKTCFDKWFGVDEEFRELTELDIKLGPLALYIEDSYVKAVIELLKLATPASSSETPAIAAETRTLQRPVRLRSLAIQPLDLTLTLHTAVRMYIALDQSPLRLSAFRVRDTMTSVERLTHALTVHYLSAAILGAGWVVGGLELLGAPGALAARVGGASGGVRGVASAAAAALLRSLSAWAGSLARNLDLLAGDEEHAKRAAAARRRPPESLMEGLGVGITNFAVNLLGAVGGLAHHPLVGVAVGETESGVAALRRGLVGALTKPLSATADLVAYAGNGLLAQAGWNPVPQPRGGPSDGDKSKDCWNRDCVRWAFRLGETFVIAGYDVLVDRMPVRLLITHKFIIVTEPESEKILEMIDLRCCSLSKYEGPVIELLITVKKPKVTESKAPEEEDEYKISAAAMARVARYTGAATTSTAEGRMLTLLSATGCSLALYTALSAAIHHASPVYLPVL